MRLNRACLGMATHFCLLLTGWISAHGAEWHVGGAPVRFVVDLANQPTHAEAGYFVHLPDGGVLPRNYPVAQVVTETGETLSSGMLWHNTIGGMALVFASPRQASKVYVYVGRGSQYDLWTPESGIYPSAILCTDPTAGRMDVSTRLSALGAVGPTVHYSQMAGHERASFCIGGDLSGRPRPSSFYLLAHLVSKDPGKTWIAPFTVDGSSQVLVNGTLLAPHKRIEKWGGTGQYVDVRPGFTRVEVLQMASGSGSYEAQGRGRRQRDSGGLMYLTWRTPNASMKELGGVRSKKVPMAGSSRMETRAVNNAEIVRSGRGKVVEAQYKDGLPVAVGTARPKHLFWFENTAPFFLYELDASRAGNPAGTTYTWQFDSRGTAITGESVQWLFPGRHEAQVKLVASSDARRSQATVPFYCYAPIKSDLNDPGTRKAFLDASLAMFTAAHRSVNPVEGCGSGYWSTLLQAVGIGEGVDLLSYLLSERPGLLTQNLPPDQIDRLREIVLDAVPRKGAAEAITWIRGQRNRTSNGRLLGRLTQAEVEVRMHYMGESNTVVRLLSPYYKQSGEMGELSRIRLGDLAFLSGDLNRATALYADVQNRVRHLRNTQERLPVGHQLGGGLARSAKELKAQREQSRAVRSSRQEDVRVDNWKLTAFLGVSVSETVKSLIDQNQLLKAHETLQAWERQFPLSKVSGDYVLQEARYYMALEDWVRARSMLEAYCDLVDASSYIPDASLALLSCMTSMGDSKTDIRAYCQRMSEKLEFHPAGEVFRSHLEGF